MTAEGAWVIGICLIIVGIGIMAGYSVYASAIEYMNTVDVRNNAVELFRMISAAGNIVK